MQDATNAITAAQNLCIPSGITLYGDIETGVATNIDWYFGWWDTMMASPYANPGGFYCNTSPENALYFNNPYCAAITSRSNLIRTKSVRCASIHPCLPVTHDPAAPLTGHRTMPPRRIAPRIPQ